MLGSDKSDVLVQKYIPGYKVKEQLLLHLSITIGYTTISVARIKKIAHMHTYIICVCVYIFQMALVYFRYLKSI